MKMGSLTFVNQDVGAAKALMQNKTLILGHYETVISFVRDECKAVS